MVQAGVTGDLPTDAFTLIAQHCAHAFQLANDPVDFLHRIGGDALDQRIRVFGGRVIGRVSLAALLAQECDVFDICPFRKSYPDVLVMQPSQDRNGDNGARSLDCSMQGRIFL
jgi:hypothetical protein